MKATSRPSTRERILNTAVDLFHRQGYTDTGINQIIAEAEIAKASLYYHFPTKEDLCIAYLEKRHLIWKEDFDAFVSRSKTPVLASFDFLIEFNKKYDYRGCSFLNILSEINSDKLEILEILQSHKLDLLAFFQGQFQNDQKELAYLIYSLFENAIMESQLFRSQEPVLRLKKIATSLLP